MELGLEGRRVLVTGATRGIGRATAEGFAREGCRLCLVARTAEALAETKAALAGRYAVDIDTLAADTGEPGATQAVAAAFPDVDILVNNAGGIVSGSLIDVDEARWRAAWEPKVFGYINMTREYYRRMAAQGSGVIVSIIGMAAEKVRFRLRCRRERKRGSRRTDPRAWRREHGLWRARRRNSPRLGRYRSCVDFTARAGRSAVRRSRTLARGHGSLAARSAHCATRSSRSGCVPRLGPGQRDQRYDRNGRSRPRRTKLSEAARNDRPQRGAVTDPGSFRIETGVRPDMSTATGLCSGAGVPPGHGQIAGQRVRYSKRNSRETRYLQGATRTPRRTGRHPSAAPDRSSRSRTIRHAA